MNDITRSMVINCENLSHGFATSEDFEKIITTYVNGNKKEFAELFDSLLDKTEFIDYINDEYKGNALIVDMMRTYFNIKG